MALISQLFALDSPVTMEHIYFEHLLLRNCGLHTLNMLLQGPYFAYEDLTSIGQQLDVAEKAAGLASDEIGENFDDTGYFSIQVLSEALRRKDHASLPLTHPDAYLHRRDPSLGQAYICNLNDHWFAVRRFGNEWFELDSQKKTPEQLKRTHLDAYFAWMMKKGASIYMIDGDLPDCRAQRFFTGRDPDDVSMEYASQESAASKGALGKTIEFISSQESLLLTESMNTDSDWDSGVGESKSPTPESDKTDGSQTTEESL
ncbi:hypothetical protein L596_012911 [Steinernema carpocapsae]|uniref:ubiquitinyl hydrolase 1 n=1 Tax=Steinernema carpocapsae TaxID=34508 RepID=A0A4U5NZ39_STECR|nr:hypothetical protein L596_012911 [Steinernema carpocapsae]